MLLNQSQVYFRDKLPIKLSPRDKKNLQMVLRTKTLYADDTDLGLGLVFSSLVKDPCLSARMFVNKQF